MIASEGSGVSFECDSPERPVIWIKLKASGVFDKILASGSRSFDQDQFRKYAFTQYGHRYR